uniref:Uncharacterized protein n=1 Tax=Parascaris equorum TaxID=6256 RepID=A0A914RDE9_PAREQ
ESDCTDICFALHNALDRNEHEFVLDWACYFYEPDDPAFVKHFDRIRCKISDQKKFSLLHSTRHFGAFVFYLVLNGNIPPLLNHFGAQGRYRSKPHVEFFNNIFPASCNDGPIDGTGNRGKIHLTCLR